MTASRKTPTFFLLLLASLLFSSMVSAYSTPIPIDSWNLDTDGGSPSIYSYFGNHTLTAVNTPSLDSTAIPAGLYQGSEYDGTTEYHQLNANISKFNFTNTQDWSIEMWIRPDKVNAYQSIIDLGASGVFSVSFLVQILNNGSLNFCTDDGCGGGDIINAGPLVADKVYHLVFTHEGGGAGVGNSSIYINGTRRKMADTDSPEGGSGFLSIGRRGDVAQYYDGSLFFLAFHGHALTTAEVAALYAAESQYSASLPAGNNYYSLNVIDLYNDSDLAGVNVTFSPGCWNLSSAAGVASVINVSDCSTLNGTLAGVTASLSLYYANATVYTIAENGSDNAGMFQGAYNVTSITRLIDAAVLSPALGTWTINTSGGKTYSGGGVTYPENVYLIDGSNNITLQYAGAAEYYDFTYEVNVTAPETLTGTVDGVYDALYYINASNAFTGVLIDNFTVTASNTTNAYSATYTTTNNHYSVPGIQGITLFFFMNATGYAYANATLTANNNTPHYGFLLYTTNSINVNIYDAATGLLITENISVTVSGNASEDIQTTTTGNTYFDLLNDGEYTVKLEGGNYSLRSYTITVADHSTQTLNAYLSKLTATVTFAVRDYDTKAVIEGCGMSMYQLINSTWTVVESKTTDITGRAQMTYVTAVKYRFDITCTGYNDKTFYLDPVIFTSYNIDMTKEITLNDDQDYMGVSVSFTPKRYYNNDVGNFTITFQSPHGLLSSYNYTFAYPGNTTSDNGVNAIGESFTIPYNLSNMTYPSWVNITYTYDTTIGTPRTFSFRYLIGGAIPSKSILDINEEDFGLGSFEKVLIAVGMTILIAGVAMFVNTIAGAGLGLVMLGFFTYIGFIPLWGVLITFTVGLMLVIRRSS